VTPEQFVAGLPKAELHMHIEGSIEPPLFFELAQRNGVTIPWKTEDELRAAYRFANLQGFLELYYDGCRVLQQARDFHDVTREYLQRAHADAVVHAEMFLGPQGHTARGVLLATAMEGVLGAIADARRHDGISAGVILVAQRHRSEAEALDLLDAAMPWADRILGFGLGGAEVGNPPQKFATFFARARERGFKVVAHAGEEGPAAYVRDSMDLLQVDRIDHGNACTQDASLVRDLAQRQVPLTMCPLSNVKLQVIRSVAEHPAKQLLDAGVCVTLNSDDPSYFGGYVNDNYLACLKALHLDRADLVKLARNSFVAAFMPDSERAAALARLDAYAGRADVRTG
jgi:adenosine deaminase